MSAKYATTHKALLVVVPVLLLLCAFLLWQQKPEQQLKTLQRQAAKIAQLAPAERAPATQQLLQAIDIQLSKSDTNIPVAQYGYELAAQHDDKNRQLAYLRYLDAQHMLSEEQLLAYAKLHYQRSGEQISPELETLIARILTPAPRQPDMMLMLGKAALLEGEYALAIKALTTAVAGLSGEDRQRAERYLQYANEGKAPPVSEPLAQEQVLE